MLFKKSQILAAFSMLRPNVNRVRTKRMQYVLSHWHRFLFSFGVPGPRASIEKITALSRRTYYIENPPIKKISTQMSGNQHDQQVIFIHGSPGSAEGWADFLNRVQQKFQYLALDRPGFGGSDPEHAVVSIADQAKAVSRVLSNHSKFKPILVGHSMGGPIAAWVAATEPNAISGLLIVAGSLDPSQEQIHPFQKIGATWPINTMLPRSIRNANHELMALKSELEKLQPLLANIQIPVFIMHGTKDDLVPIQNIEYMRDHLTGTDEVIVKQLDGFNHFLPWNAQAHIEAAIMELARRA